MELFRRRKGQMQMGEMVLVLLVAFLIGIAALTFFVRRTGEESVSATNEQKTRQLVIIAKEVASLPGIRYSLDGREDLTAIDTERAKAFALIISEPQYREVYRERFAGYKAEIIPIFPDDASYILPETPPFSTITLFDYTDSGTPGTPIRNSVPFTIPVLLYEPTEPVTGFGILVVTQVSE